mmetsp:Transcript_35652/g.101606  ORF Transcript_35652/g.101606 Transcript_35652/m.101606 type:complete len:201 (-) Transcript_35652:674-1276(-)
MIIVVAIRRRERRDNIGEISFSGRREKLITSLQVFVWDAVGPVCVARSSLLLPLLETELQLAITLPEGLQSAFHLLLGGTWIGHDSFHILPHTWRQRSTITCGDSSCGTATYASASRKGRTIGEQRGFMISLNFGEILLGMGPNLSGRSSRNLHCNFLPFASALFEALEECLVLLLGPSTCSLPALDLRSPFSPRLLARQ